MTYKSKKEPWAHQHEALRRLEGREAFALFMAMRTGKTKVALDDFGRLEFEGKCQDLLVIAPAGVYRTWTTAIKEHVNCTLADRIKVFVWSAGENGVATKKQLNSFMKELAPRVLLMNVEALSSVKRAQQLCIDFLCQKSTMMIIDESTTIKSPLAKRTKFIVQQLAPRADFRRILSGLPTPQSPLDLYAQFKFLDARYLGFNSYVAFHNRYAITQKIPHTRMRFVVGYRDVAELQAKIAPHSYRVTLEECYDLPPKIYQIREVELLPRQKEIYDELKKYATAQLNELSHVTATHVLTQILRLHQVLCGHVKDELGNEHSLPEQRTQALLDLLQEHSGKAIIWCSYDHDVQKVSIHLQGVYGPNSVARFWGGNRSTREEEEHKFLHDEKCKFMVATAAAGGRGRTWTVADLIVYYSNTHNLEHRSQSEERAQGIDKFKSVLYVDLITPGTVDEKIIKALRSKINLAATITGDNYKEWLI